MIIGSIFHEKETSHAMKVFISKLNSFFKYVYIS